MGALRKILLIMWKNWILRKRHYIMTAFEIILPSLLAMLLVLLRISGGQSFSIKYIDHVTAYNQEQIMATPMKSCKDQIDDTKNHNNVTLLYTPDSTEIKELLACLQNYYRPKFSITLKYVKDEKAMEKYTLDAYNNNNHSISEKLWGGIAFVDSNTFHYRIRTVQQGDWHTQSLNAPIREPYPPSSSYYLWGYQYDRWGSHYNGWGSHDDRWGSFIEMQHLIAMYNIEKQKPANFDPGLFNVTSQVFPYPPYYSDAGFNSVMSELLPLFVCLSYVFIVPTLIKKIVAEKELGIKELMKMMGLHGWIQWVGWFCSSFIMMSISSIIIVALLCLEFTAETAIFNYSAPELILFTFFLYIASAIAFCFFISSFFSKPSVATGIGCIIWILSYMGPNYSLQTSYDTMSLNEKLSLCLLPNMAMALSVRTISGFESRNMGLRWNTLSAPGIKEDNITELHIWGMMVLDLVLYSLLTWYMDNIFPGVYGVKKPWYFLFTKSYWIKDKWTSDTEETDEFKNEKDFEGDPVGLTPTVTIKNLSKAYKPGCLVVNNLSLNIYEGQITALLGHNGAGKTTTMSILTGMIAPTGGTAIIEGHNIATDLDGARGSLGLCPQHNMLFDILTVREHLLFFGKLKGMSGKELDTEVDNLLIKLQLTEKKHVQARSLSGGMKRKLNLGIALVGGTKVVMLDEPTSGMDPEARRAIWDLLQEYRKDRCVLLTTHFMEEADVLADRIAIMAHGKMQCCGTTMFLKKRYGAGYHLSITKNDTCDVNKLTNIIKKYLPEAYIDNVVSTEVSFVLPSEETLKFPKLFQELESNLEKLGVDGFGVSVTTMEEVFLKVGEIVDDNIEEAYNMDATVETIDLTGRSEGISTLTFNFGYRLWVQRFCGLLLKRLHYGRRRWAIIVAQLLVPALMVTCILLINNAMDEIIPMEPPRTMDITQYGEVISFYSAEEASGISKTYHRVFPSGYEVKNVDNVSAEIINIGTKSLADYNDKYIVAAEFDGNATENDVSINVMYNGIYYHSLPLSLNLIHNAILMHQTNNTKLKFIVENAPLPKNPEEVETITAILKTVKSVLMGIFMPIGMSIMAASFVIFPIHERVTKAKHIQLMTGVGGILFWGTSFLWDFVLHIVSSCLMTFLFATVDTGKSFVGDGQSGVTFLLLLMYGWAAIPFSYIFSFISDVPSSGFNRLTILNLIAGIIFGIMIFFFTQFGAQHLKDAAEVIQWFTRLLPIYPITMGFMLIPFIADYNSKCGGCIDYMQWDSPGIAQEVMMLAIDGFLYFVIIFLIEAGYLYKLWYLISALTKKSNPMVSVVPSQETLDSDVSAENHRVKNIAATGTSGNDALVVHNLSKHFWSFVAVDDLNFGVQQSECFGLLGVNGAGKTTTFRMLTGDEIITNGNAFIQNLSLKQNHSQFLERISYCPQFDALIEYLTGRETLWLYARLRGIDEQQIKSEISKILEMFDLIEHADKITKTYSGGNKRKLSSAIAFLGNRPLVFLDEPTTGVDPVARRKLWSVLLSAKNAGISIILTSHSMEECEVLCSRIAIMVNGKFQCLGACQHLKNKFGEGYTIIAKLAPREDQNIVQEQLQQYIQSKLPNSILKDVHQGLIHYQVTDKSFSWSYLFQVMEEAKFKFKLEDYSVSQATLEQIFLSFARKQRVEDESKKRK